MDVGGEFVTSPVDRMIATGRAIGGNGGGGNIVAGKYCDLGLLLIFDCIYKIHCYNIFSYSAYEYLL